MKRIRIVHSTAYFYHEPVAFGPHLALVRPREGHDLHIAASRLDIEPAATVNWLRDINGNSIAVITFLEPAAKMSVLSEVEVDLYEEAPIEGLIESYAQTYPFQYAPEEQVEI
ncbi:MAG: transglutaminase N-terminal domain-containing protein, partial [Planctomycetia bacterium]